MPRGRGTDQLIRVDPTKAEEGNERVNRSASCASCMKGSGETGQQLETADVGPAGARGAVMAQEQRVYVP